jgi:hypothetical protein
MFLICSKTDIGDRAVLSNPTTGTKIAPKPAKEGSWPRALQTERLCPGYYLLARRILRKKRKKTYVTDITYNEGNLNHGRAK